MWIRRAELGDRLVDVHIHDGLIAEIAEVADHAPRGTGSFGGELDAAGGALLPGLHDHHVHLLAGAAALASVDAGPAAVRDAARLASALRAADRALPPGAWLRAVGYHESVAGDIDAAWLDALGIRRPIRMQHRTYFTQRIESLQPFTSHTLPNQRIQLPGHEQPAPQQVGPGIRAAVFQHPRKFRRGAVRNKRSDDRPEQFTQHRNAGRHR